ncbi:hypothetical protein ABD76_13045 [Paenibacillus dendritiformis]|nr:hypothetical protein [Paenibacillus dendritiformis]
MTSVAGETAAFMKRMTGAAAVPAGNEGGIDGMYFRTVRPCRASRSGCAPGPSIRQLTNAGVDKADYLAHTIVDSLKGRQNAVLYISHTIGCHLFCPYPLGQFGQIMAFQGAFDQLRKQARGTGEARGAVPRQHSRKVFVIKGLTLIRQCKQAHRQM